MIQVVLQLSLASRESVCRRQAQHPTFGGGLEQDGRHFDREYVEPKVQIPADAPRSSIRSLDAQSFHPRGESRGLEPQQLGGSVSTIDPPVSG